MRKVLASLITAVGTLCAAPLYAQQGFNYNYLDVGIRTGEVLGFDVFGFGAEASYVLAPNVRLKGAADWLDADDIDTSAQNVALQAGYFTPLAPNVDVVVDGGLLYTNVDDVDDDTGLKLDAIIRVRADPRFEFNAGLSYVDIFDDSETGIHLAGIYALNPDLSLLARFDDIGETELWSFGVRLSY